MSIGLGLGLGLPYSKVLSDPSIVNTYYVRPSGSTYGTGDGSSYANAWSGFSNIVWASVENNILAICGTHLEKLNVGIGNCTIIGNDPNEAGVIDGENTRLTGAEFNSLDNINFNSLTINNHTDTNLFIRGTSSNIVTNDCVMSGSGDQSIQHYNTCSVTHNNLTGDSNSDETLSLHDSSVVIVNGGTFTNCGAAINAVHSSTITVNGNVTYSGNTDDILINSGDGVETITATLNNQTFTSRVLGNTGAVINLNNCIVPSLQSQFLTFPAKVTANNSIIENIIVESGADMYLNSCLITTGVTISGYCLMNDTRCDAKIDLTTSGALLKGRQSLFYSDANEILIRFRAGTICDLEYCTLYGTDTSANYLLRLDAGVTLTNCNNNTFTSNGGTKSGIISLINITISNNIFTNLVTAIVASGGTITSINSCINNNNTNTSGSVTETSTVSTSPLLVDVVNLDFSLGAGSSCIGTGETLTDDEGIDTADWGNGTTTTPIVTTKAQGASWDIGAYIS